MTAVWHAWIWQLAALLLVPLCALAQNPMPPAKVMPLIPAENHPWARFPLGSWTLSRVTTESYDARGVATTSVEEFRNVLKSADDAGYTLSVERIVQAGGQRLLKPPAEQTFGLSGERGTEKVESTQTLGESELSLNGRKVPCEVRQAVLIDSEQKRRTVKVLFSPEVRPHALRREWQIVGNEGTIESTFETVVSVGLPYPVVGKLRAAAFRHATQKQGALTKESVEVICDEVPGGVVSLWSKDLDAEGKLIRRTTQELVNYDVVEQAPPVSPARTRLERKRARRAEDKPGQRRQP